MLVGIWLFNVGFGSRQTGAQGFRLSNHLVDVVVLLKTGFGYGWWGDLQAIVGL